MKYINLAKVSNQNTKNWLKILCIRKQRKNNNKKKHSPNSQIPSTLKAPDNAMAIGGAQASDAQTPSPRYSAYETDKLKTNIK